MSRINIVDLRIEAHEAINAQVEYLFKKMARNINDSEYREKHFFNDLFNFWNLVASLGVLSQYKKDRNPKFEQSTDVIQIGLSAALKQLDADEDYERDQLLELIRGFAAYSGRQ